MEVQNLSGDCLFSPTLIGLTGGKLDFGSIGQGAPYFDPRPFTFTNFRDEITNQYNTAFTPSFKQYINYEISAITQCVSAYTSGSTGIVNYWSADTVALPADYIRVSGNSTSAIVGGNLEVSGVVRTNRISGGIPTSPIYLLPDNSDKRVVFGYSTQQGLGSIYSFLTLQFESPSGTDTLFQLSQGGDLVFKSNSTNGHELFRLDQDLNQASAYTLTAANSLGVSGDTEVAGTLSGRTISGRTLTLKENLGVSGRTYLGTLDAAGAGYSNDKILVAQSNGEVEYLTAAELAADGGFWSADTTALPATYIRTSGNTTGVKIGGNLDVSGNTVVDGIITASGTSANPESKIQLVADGGSQLVGLERVGAGANAVKGQVKIRDNNAVDVYFTAEDNIAAYINNAGAALSIGGTSISEANTNLYVTGGGIITGGLGVSGDTEVTGTLSADTMSGRTLQLKGHLGVSGNTFLGGGLGVSGDTYIAGPLSADTMSGRTLTLKKDLGVSGNTYVTGNVGIQVQIPLTALDVHHDPTGLATDTGGGEVVTFGSNTSGMVAGKLYYLNASGAWALTDADSTGTGASQLLGIALGAATSNGVLLRGFFDMASYLGPGAFNQGKPLYVSGTLGSIAVTQPAGSTDFVRVVGYCTDTANVIYFNPDGTYIKIA